MTKPKVYEHAPEFFHAHFFDTGCSVAPRCLECPLPMCRYDVQGGEKALGLKVRDAAIRQARDLDESLESIAERFAMTTRSVRRVLA